MVGIATTTKEAPAFPGDSRSLSVRDIVQFGRLVALFLLLLVFRSFPGPAFPPLLPSAKAWLTSGLSSLFAIQNNFRFVRSFRGAGHTIALTKARQSRTMRFKEGQVWRCLNDACGAQLTVTTSGELDEGGNPRCCCGSLMKMPYEQPRIRFSDDSQEIRKLLQQLAAVLH